MTAIPIEKLASIKKFICHANCPDGLASALILDDAFPGVEIVFAQHNKTVLTPEPDVLFCDYCPTDRVDEWRDLETVILDHHKGADGAVERIVRSFKYHAFGDEEKDPGVSGAVLAYRHAWLVNDEQDPSDRALWRNTVERFARIAGIRDTWQKQDPDWHEGGAQAEMLMFYPEDIWLGKKGEDGQRVSPLILRQPSVLAGMREAGRISYEKRLRNSEQLSNNAMLWASAKGTRVAILPARYVSDAADNLADVCELAVGFTHEFRAGMPYLIVSTRSRNRYDCAGFCKFLGGNGHTNAAGATIKLTVGDPEPIRMLQYLIDSYEAKPKET